MGPKYNQSLGIRIAEEAQLLAEEKWIINALTKIRNQRNCLQIERLHLESLKSQLLKKTNPVSQPESESISPSTSQAAATDILPNQDSALNLMQNPSIILQNDIDETRFEVVDELCNIEELNLMVTNSVFNNPDPDSFDMEEEDEDIDNCEIDMNMFMNGKIGEGDGNCSSDKMLDEEKIFD